MNLFRCSKNRASFTYVPSLFVIVFLSAVEQLAIVDNTILSMIHLRWIYCSQVFCLSVYLSLSFCIALDVCLIPHLHYQTVKVLPLCCYD